MWRTLQAAGHPPALASAADLDDDRVSDVCIGLHSGPGGRFRVLHRTRATLREALRLAGQTASVLAGASQEKVLDPQCRPSAIRISDEPEGAYVLLDYDVGMTAEARPRSSRPLRLVMRTSKVFEPAS